MTALTWQHASTPPGDGINAAQLALLLGVAFASLVAAARASRGKNDDRPNFNSRDDGARSRLMSLFETFAGGVGATCLCAAPLLALAAFDIDESRPARAVLNWSAIGLAAIAIATTFV